MTEEVGRELKVSELVPRTVVVLQKAGLPMATIWVVEVTNSFVEFTSGVLRTTFVARRTGPDLEWITDESGKPMYIYEYLGEV